jgi:hypothetical protein
LPESSGDWLFGTGTFLTSGHLAFAEESVDNLALAFAD